MGEWLNSTVTTAESNAALVWALRTVTAESTACVRKQIPSSTAKLLKKPRSAKSPQSAQQTWSTQEPPALRVTLLVPHRSQNPAAWHEPNLPRKGRFPKAAHD